MQKNSAFIFDAHLHLDLYPPADLPGLLADAAKVGVRGCLLAGVWPGKLQTSLDLFGVGVPAQLSSLGQWIRVANRRDFSKKITQDCAQGEWDGGGRFLVLLALGMHPVIVAQQPNTCGLQTQQSLFQQELTRYQHYLFALGETGFDYRPAVLAACAEGIVMAKRLQWEAFAFCVDCALQFNLPLILHSVAAYSVTLEGVKYALAKGVRRIQIHGFSGNACQAAEFTKLGVYLGFGGVVTWSHAQRARQAFLACPSDRFLLETDGPDQPLERADGTRPQRHEPHMLQELSEQLARMRQVSAAKLAEDSNRNLFRFLGLSS